MSTKHSPGPWLVRVGGGRVHPSVAASDGASVCSCTGSAPGFGTYALESDDLRLANARLIAAAPALLDALKAMLREHDAMSTPLPGNAGDRWPETATAARTAIAKAEGLA
jgi:hypothetical protein